MANNHDALVYASAGIYFPPPGSRIAAFLRSTGLQSGDPQFIGQNLVTTLNAAAARCRSGMDDIIVALPGHSENISTADQISSLVAGTKIIGIGSGTTQPKLIWSAAASTFLFDVADVELNNFNLQMSGNASGSALTVTAPITVSAAGCSIKKCRINVADDADELAATAITTTAAGDDFTIEDCHFYGATAGEVTTVLRLVGADRFVMRRTRIECATASVTTGVMTFATTASTQILLEDNYYNNRKALSQCCVVGLAGTTGISRREHFAYLDTASLTPWLTSTGSMVFHRPTVTNTAGETGSEVVGTVSA